MLEFSKKQKLCNEAAIKEMFSNGKSFVVAPIRLIWKEELDSDSVAIKSIIIAPKKQLKLATDRNIVRRRMKEAYRLNKAEIECFLVNNNRQLNVAIIYQNEKILSYKAIEKRIKLILERLKEEI